MIRIDFKENLIEEKKIQFLNNNEECIICNQPLNKDNDLILINDLCKCYNATKICEECFTNWISLHNECIICRKKYDIEFNNRINMYHSDNEKIKKNLLELQKKIDLIKKEEISEELPDDIRRLINYNQFSSLRTCKMWLYHNRRRLILYSFGYGFIAFAYISIKKTLYYENNNPNNNHTYPIIQL